MRLRAYSHWVSRVAARSRGAARHQRTTAAVNDHGMLPTTANGSSGGATVRKSACRRSTCGSAAHTAASSGATVGSTS